MPGAKPKASLSKTELVLMDVVWRRGEASVATVWREGAGARRLARNTVQTMLTRLEAKGWLRHRQDGKAFLYSATADRHGTLRELVHRLVDTAFAGSG